MAVAYFPLTVDVGQIIGTTLREAHVRVSTNLPRGVPIAYGGEGKVVTPDAVAKVDKGLATFQMPTKTGATNVSDWQYVIEIKAFVEGITPLDLDPIYLNAPTATTAVNVASLIGVTSAPPAFIGAAVAQLTAAGQSSLAGTVAARDQAVVAKNSAVSSAAAAEAARVAAENLVITDLGTTDGQTKTLIEAEASATRAALNNALARPIAGAVDAAPLGSELFTGGTWTLGDGWTGTAATGFTYAYPGAGSPGDHTLTWTPPFDPTSKRYLVSYRVAEPNNNALFRGSFGGVGLSIMYQGFTHPATYTRGVHASANLGLVIAPEVSQWNGTVSQFSIREVLSQAPASAVAKDADGVVAIERRTTPASQRNVLEGRNAGRWNVNGFANSITGEGAFASNISGFWNAGIGTDTLAANVSGSRNCTLGVFSLLRNTTGHRNIAIGPYAMPYNTTGHNNVGIGVDVMWECTTGQYNVAIGTGALADATSGGYNVALGRSSLANLTTHDGCVGIGDQAGAEVISTSQGKTVAIGYRALRNATASGNTAIGDEAMTSTTTGMDSVAVGRRAFFAATEKGINAGLGNFAGENVNGELNTAVGRSALRGATGSTAERNTAIGAGSGGAVTSAARNVFIGHGAGKNVTTGSRNIVIGYDIETAAAGDSDRINIGGLIHGRMDVGRVGIGVNAPEAQVHIKASTGAAGTAPLKFTAGTLLATGASNNGCFEFDGTDLYFTAGGTRKKFTLV